MVNGGRAPASHNEHAQQGTVTLGAGFSQVTRYQLASQPSPREGTVGPLSLMKDGSSCHPGRGFRIHHPEPETRCQGLASRPGRTWLSTVPLP